MTGTNIYDVIIIGGGVSGMSAAVLLSRKGKKVLVLEKHNTVGGLLGGFKRKGYFFDCGIAKVPTYSIQGFLETLGIWDQIPFVPIRTTIRVRGQALTFTSLREAFDKIASIFPEEAKGISAFYREQVRDLEPIVAAIFAVPNPLMSSGWKRITRLGTYLGTFVRSGWRSAHAFIRGFKVKGYDVLRRYLKQDGEAYAFLTAQGYHSISLPMFLALWCFYFADHYPVNGFQQIATELAERIRAQQGIVLTNATAQRVCIEHSVCVGVDAIVNGLPETFRARKVICAIDLKKAYFQLIGEAFMEASFRDTLQRQTLSGPVPIVYLGFRLPKDKLRKYFHGNEELLFLPSLAPRSKTPDNRAYYLGTSFTAHSSCLLNASHAPEDGCNLQIYLPSPPPGWLQDWGIVNGQRTPQYHEIKRMVLDQVLDVLTEVIPELRDRSLIDVCELGTPFTIERYTGNSEGSSIGFAAEQEKTIVQKGFLNFFDHDAHIRNLYFCGHQTGYLGGITNAILSAQHLATRLR